MAKKDDLSPAQQKRRESLLDAAGKVFAAKGYAVATVDDIAAEASVSKGSVYNYFKNKQDLFAQVFVHALSQEEQTLGDLVEDTRTAWEKIDAILDLWYERHAYYQQVGRLVLEFWSAAAGDWEEGTFASIHKQMFEGFQDQIAGIIRKGQQDGEFRQSYPPIIAATVIMAMLDGINIQAMLGVGIDINNDVLVTLKLAIFNSLSAEGTQETPPLESE